MAQTMSLIEPTDSRAMRPMDASGVLSGSVSTRTSLGLFAEYRTSPSVRAATSLSSAIRVRLAPMSSWRSVAMRVRISAISSSRATR